MVPQFNARIDGLPATLPGPEQLAPDLPVHSGQPSARQRARIERQTAVVHEARTPVWARAFVARQLAEEDAAIRRDLAEAGIL